MGGLCLREVRFFNDPVKQLAAWTDPAEMEISAHLCQIQHAHDRTIPKP